MAAATLDAPGICLGSCKGSMSDLAAATSIAQGANDSGLAIGLPAGRGDLAEVAAAAPAVHGIHLTSCRGSVSGLAAATGIAQGANDSGCAVELLVACGDLAEVAAAALNALGIRLGSCKRGMSGLAAASSIAQGADDSGCAVGLLAACWKLAEAAAATLAAHAVHLASCRGSVSGLAAATGIPQGANDFRCAIGLPAACMDLAEVSAAGNGGLVSDIISPVSGAAIHCWRTS